MTRRDEILAAIQGIPALPAAAVEILQLAQSPDTGIAEITQAMESDPGLTVGVPAARKLRLFRGSTTGGLAARAGVMFGLNRIIQLVLAAAVFPIVRIPLRGYDLPPSALLRHLVAVGIGAEELAKVVGIPAPQHTFTAGILHDVGKIVLGTFMEANGTAILKLATIQGVSFEDAERHVLGTDHAEAGAALLEYWGLPGTIVQAVRWHHHPERLSGDRTVVDLVHVADLMSITCGVGVGIDGLNYAPAEDVVERLGLNNAKIEEATARMLAGLGATNLPLE